MSCYCIRSFEYELEMSRRYIDSIVEAFLSGIFALCKQSGIHSCSTANYEFVGALAMIHDQLLTQDSAIIILI